MANDGGDNNQNSTSWWGGAWESVKSTARAFTKAKIYKPLREFFYSASLGAVTGPLTLAVVFNQTNLIATPFSAPVLAALAFAQGAVLRAGYKSVEAVAKAVKRKLNHRSGYVFSLPSQTDQARQKLFEGVAFAVGSTGMVLSTALEAKKMCGTEGLVANLETSKDESAFETKCNWLMGGTCAAGCVLLALTFYLNKLGQELAEEQIPLLSVQNAGTAQAGAANPSTTQNPPEARATHSPGAGPATLSLVSSGP